MAEQMKIFVSWSKFRSQLVALALDDFLGKIFPTAKVWMSAQDIGLGERWDDVLSKELEDSHYGILCLTMENLDKPWLLFEAGALSKQIKDPRVIPYRFQVPISKFSGPLARFQGTDASRDGTFELVKTINDFQATSLTFKELETAFDDFWPDYEAALEAIPDFRLDGKSPIRGNRKIQYAWTADPKKKISIYTGDIKRIRDVDIWVNSENTNMQMARFYDKSISAIIRYLGAKRNVQGEVEDDLVANELRALFPPDDPNIRVKTASVFATSGGELAKTHKVKKIIHVASVQGEDGYGYRPVAGLQDCVYNALEKAKELADAPNSKITSILFPLLGTGTGGADINEIVEKLVEEVMVFFEVVPDSKITEVFFLAFNKAERWALEDKLRGSEELEKVKPKG